MPFPSWPGVGPLIHAFDIARDIYQAGHDFARAVWRHDGSVRCGDRGRRGDGLLHRLSSSGRPCVPGLRARGREGHDLPALGLGAVARLDPPAILLAREHPHLALRHLLPEAGGGGPRGRRGAAGNLLPRGRLSLSRERSEPRDPRREPGAANGRRRRHPAARSGGACRALPLAQSRRHFGRHLGAKR